MKPSIVFLLLCLLPLAAAACRSQSDDALRASLMQYLSAVNAVGSVTDAKLAPLEQRLDAALDENDLLTADETEALRTYFSARAAVVGETIDPMNRIEPPDELAAAHRAYIDAASTLRDVLQNAATLEFARADAEVLADLAPAVRRVAAACAALQDVADANEIEVILGCGS